jgi:2-keto-3-deoxy-L-rhamnonate aldolase RhmA
VFLLNNKAMKTIQLMLITPHPEIAAYAEESGVGRIFIDMEINGKNERQKNMHLPLHQHTFADVKAIKKAVRKSEVMVRINPYFAGTKDEVNQAIDSGADCIMLPYFTHQDEVEGFLNQVNGRVKTNILLETATAVARANSIFCLKNLDEVHIGLNDLKLTFQLKFLYETLAGGIVDHLSSLAKKYQLSFGIGGIGAISKGSDIPPELIIKEHVRLGSERVILSRAFTGAYTTVEDLVKQVDLKKEVQLLRETEKIAHARTKEQIKNDRLLMIDLVNKKVKSL